MDGKEYVNILVTLKDNLQFLFEQYEAAERSMVNHEGFHERRIMESFEEIWKRMHQARSVAEKDRRDTLASLSRAYYSFAEIVDVIPPEAFIVMESH
jgi:hypothetical protein